MGTNTGIGIGIGIPFKNNALGGDNIYFPPELKARMIGVWDNYGKKNTDADRNIIKNKIPNAGGDLEILNSAYKLNSGFGEYREDFTSWIVSKEPMTVEKTDSQVHISYIGTSYKELPMFEYSGPINENYSLTVEIQGIPNNVIGKFIHNNGFTQEVTNGINTIKFSNSGSWYGFTFYREDNTIIGDCNITIKQIPAFEGALVTDGINDIIASIKTLEDWNVGDKGITIISMIHQISTSKSITTTTNNLRNEGRVVGRNIVNNTDKTGIYGWYKEDLQGTTATLISNILGDKNDYTGHYTESTNPITNSKFYVQGYAIENGFTELSSVAHYWTFAVLGKATADEINLIIAKYNLDRTLRPDILCNITKQGITNDNHADFNDKLIDYSGNGRDLQLFNIGWKGESGIGRYTEEFKNDYWIVHKEQTGIIKDGNSIKVVGKLSNYYIVYHTRTKAINSFKLRIKGIKTEIIYSYISSDKEQSISFKEDGIYDIPASEAVDSTFTLGFYFRYNDINLDWTGLTIEIIPSNKGALCLDGINDFGKVINMPIYKDYTIIADYIRTQVNINAEINSDSCVLSKSESQGVGAFMFNLISNNRESVSYSFGHRNIVNIDDTIRAIYYQSKYVNNGQNIDIESAFVDSDKLWLGTFRDNDSRFLNGAIYFLMSFPYSMNKFLIERQLKKYKAGTLYKDMVEFRPVINSNIDIKNIVYLDKDSNVIKVGDYISIGSNIKTSITVLDGYKISKVSSTAFNNITIEKSNTDFIYDVIFYGIKKSPQKINLVIEQDSDYVQWNPNIKANVSKYSVTANIRKTDGTTLKLVNGQFYSTSITGDLVLDIVPPYKDSDEVTNVVIDGKSYTPTKDSSGNYYRLEIPLVFPKEINITIQEYVRYEDIVQPYPVLLRFKDENNNEISWGDKIKLGSSITRIGLFNDCNLLKDIYTVSNAKLNGNPLTSTPHVVERQMVFTCTATWIFDDNEPKCILSPRLLHAPNSSYKILRHIPDISGHGNHGVIHNSAYAEGSGVNEDGSYQFDGVDDFITIPTLSKGGKQVLMKVNWSTLNGFIYDQRPASGDKTFGIYAQDDVIAYSQHNNGNTYIDGIINNNIIGNNLSKIIHNIVATCDVNNSITPSIGKRSYSNSYFAQMSLYDFMLFDEISTDDKIKELNTYIGITPKVTLPNYYWDNYGKKNTDANRSYIDEQVSLQKTGTSVNPLENFNIGYEGMSGYNGYPVVFGVNKTWKQLPTYNFIYSINDNKIHITKVLGANRGLIFSYVKQNDQLYDITEIPSFKIRVSGLKGDSKLKYSYIRTKDAVYQTLLDLDNGIHELPKSLVPTNSISNNSWIGFTISPIVENEIAFDCDITIEVLPEYENGLAYDGVSDFTDNKNIPIFTDFTAIIKRVDLDAKNDNSTVMFKGNKIYESSIGNGFILDYCYNSKNYVYSYGKLNQIKRDDSKIIYLTPESYNGNSIIKGENEDNPGLVFGKYWKGIIYKTILYSKTISLLEINFLKNLMEKDEIIDINHPIFISNTEDESNASQDT